jgi:DNA-binding XRE family transcriptional regulator
MEKNRIKKNRIKKNRIKKLRIFRGLLQREIAEKSGISIQTFRTIEGNKNKTIKLTIYRKIAVALDFKLRDLFINDEEEDN